MAPEVTHVTEGWPICARCGRSAGSERRLKAALPTVEDVTCFARLLGYATVAIPAPTDGQDTACRMTNNSHSRHSLASRAIADSMSL